jgi:hypothetical protein
MRKIVAALLALLVATTSVEAQSVRAAGLPGLKASGLSFVGGGVGYPAAGSVADYDFRNNQYSGPVLTVVNSTGGYVDDSAGNWTFVPANTLRRSDKGVLVEGGQTNSIRNNAMVGAVAGTPGTLPTGWSYFATAGLTTQVVSVGVRNGVDVIRLRLSGTPTATFFVLAFDNTAITASAGQLWSNSAFGSIVGGTQTNVVSVNTQVRPNGAGSVTEVSMSLDATLKRQPPSSATLVTGVTSIYPALGIYFANTTTAVDVTLEIGWPQLEQWNTNVAAQGGASSPIRTTGATATRASDLITANMSMLNPAGVTIAAATRESLYRSAAGTIALINNPGFTTGIRLRHRGAPNETAYAAGSDNFVSQTDGAFSLGARAAVSGAFAPNDIALSTYGGAPLSIGAATMPTSYAQMNIGAGDNAFFGYIERLFVLPYRAANSNLQTYSTLSNYGP